MASTDPSAEKQEPKVDQQQSPAEKVDMPNGMTLTVEELYDKDKFDLSTMEPGDVFQLLQYVFEWKLDCCNELFFCCLDSTYQLPPK